MLCLWTPTVRIYQTDFSPQAFNACHTHHATETFYDESSNLPNNHTGLNLESNWHPNSHVPRQSVRNNGPYLPAYLVRTYIQLDLKCTHQPLTIARSITPSTPPRTPQNHIEANKLKLLNSPCFPRTNQTVIDPAFSTLTAQPIQNSEPL